MVGIELPGEDRVPSGPARDLVVALHDLYRGAGRPGLRKIAEAVVYRDDFTDTVSHETVSDMLNGKGIPRWSKLNCVVRQLAEMNTPPLDPSKTAKRFLHLWNAVADGSPELVPSPAHGSRSDAGRGMSHVYPGARSNSPLETREKHDHQQAATSESANIASPRSMRPEDWSLIYEQRLKLALMEIGYRVQERSENAGPTFVVEDDQHVIFVDAHHDMSVRPLSASIVDSAIEFAERAVPSVLLVASKLPAKRAQSAIKRAKNIAFVLWRDERENEELRVMVSALLAHSRA
jgi:hypothetical protein